MFDLDHFKSINDRYDHLQGDRVLIDFCQIVQALMPGDSERAQQVCERI